jgi:hypothetical protein
LILIELRFISPFYKFRIEDKPNYSNKYKAEGGKIKNEIAGWYQNNTKNQIQYWYKPSVPFSPFNEQF